MGGGGGGGGCRVCSFQFHVTDGDVISSYSSSPWSVRGSFNRMLPEGLTGR